MTQALSASQVSQLVITATRVVSFAGESSETLHAAVVGGVCSAAFQTSSLYAVGDESAEATPVLAATMELQGATRSQCLVELIYRALSPVLAQALNDTNTAPIVSILLPMLGQRYARAQRIDFEAMRQTLCEVMPELQPDRLNLIPHQLGATAELLRLQQRLVAEPGQRAILCGADSLINGMTYLELAEKGTLATRSHLDGIVPGEGAAAVLIERAAPDRNAGQPPLAHIVGMASVPEVQVGQAALQPLKGAVGALRQAAASEPEILDQGGIVFVGHAQGIADDLEWHQLVRELSPETLGERERVAMMLGEVDSPQPEERTRLQRIKLSSVTGEIGAASLPMQLAIACEQFRYEAHMARFGFPKSQLLMVLENGDYPLRGAICLQPANVNPRADDVHPT
ncbi:MAG: hypothetical protein KZQ93_05200 [Candidatus Thiodiazotropha sp. (ex Monitilora ramsayi)]|nr:hypothetical protein [Candidatus Thiodiazotropha sp. (ex Monitilora ramsayi)]